MGLQITIAGGEGHEVALTRRAGGNADSIWIDGREHRCHLRAVGHGYEVTLDERTEPIWLVVDHDTVFIHAFGRSWSAEVVDPTEKSAMEGNRGDMAQAPMPGTVISIAVASGDWVTVGQPLMIIESMKLQSEIVAWRDGVVDRVPVQVGDTFDRGAGLVLLQSEEAA
ncbi:MAG: acetyl-CoA carboxylase biotin carboxyl carrier protein subunit [Actinomycetia bacterium]|nr:acetyl-CoA carboxylase biotin carboxyl carrier protein subunit [Actinomycetes bacterium]